MQILLYLCGGFVKKTQKTPFQEIHHAQSIRDIYFNQKK